MDTSELGEGTLTAYVGTISYRLSDRDFADFVRNGARSNDLPYFVERLGVLQARLEGVQAKDFLFNPNNSEKDFDINYRKIQVEKLTVISISYESGSVLAKIQVGVVLVASATAFLADYKDAKAGYAELRDDIVAMAQEIFTPMANPPQPGGHAPNEEITFYFTRPERFEETIRKELEKKKEAERKEQERRAQQQ